MGSCNQGAQGSTDTRTILGDAQVHLTLALGADGRQRQSVAHHGAVARVELDNRPITAHLNFAVVALVQRTGLHEDGGYWHGGQVGGPSGDGAHQPLDLLAFDGRGGQTQALQQGQLGLAQAGGPVDLDVGHHLAGQLEGRFQAVRQQLVTAVLVQDQAPGV